jgi:hypothetical protein
LVGKKFGVLCDTGFLIRLNQPQDPLHANARGYQRELTGAAFNTLRHLVKAMCIDSHEEMKSAWRALGDAGMPAGALAVFCDVSIMPYAAAAKGDPRFDGGDPLETAAQAARIGEWFRANYHKAEQMCGGGP